MHELSVARAIVDAATRHADGRRVKLVALRLGSLRQVVPDSLSFYFEIVARDTLCEGATLEQELVAARLRCPACGFEWDPSRGPVTFRCPECATPGEVEAGEELEVESIEVEDAAGAGVPQ